MEHLKVVFLLIIVLSVFINVLLAKDESSASGLTVIISYAKLTTFFSHPASYSSEVNEKFSKCNVHFNLYPCATTKIVNGVLTNIENDSYPDLDRMFACATKLNESNMQTLSKFVFCMRKENSKLSSAQSCATKNSLNWNDIDKCRKSPEADQYCDNYWKLANEKLKLKYKPGIWMLSKEVIDETGAPFSSYLCEALKEKNISCPACKGSCGGSGSGTPSP